MNVNKYRLYCITESNYVFAWGESNPTTCPNNPLDAIDAQSVTIVDTSTVPTYVDPFTRVWMDARNTSGISLLKDRITGTVITQSNVDGSPLELQGTSQLSTTQLGMFQDAKVSLTLRSASSNGNCKWGYYDNYNGYYFALSSNNNLDCVVLRESTPTVLLTRSNHDATTHKAYDITYSPQYVKFQVNGGVICERVLTVPQSPSYHAYPIRVASSNSAVLQVLQRKYLIRPTEDLLPKPVRNMSITKTIAMPGATTFVPLLTIRRKDQSFTTWIKLISMEFYPTTSDIFLDVRANSVLTGDVFTAASSDSPDSPDSIAEADTTATAATAGVSLWSGTAVAASAKMVLDILDTDVYDSITIAGKAITTAGGSLYVSLRWREGW